MPFSECYMKEINEELLHLGVSPFMFELDASSSSDSDNPLARCRKKLVIICIPFTVFHLALIASCYVMKCSYVGALMSALLHHRNYDGAVVTMQFCRRHFVTAISVFL